ncbi:hypothetical protein [uncultured Psychroserpens sp.]|uniref:hypothetical protein n=1 Tax=uncultured Psychroserpens sp. TaxID=255436 RepID=UPI0026124C50|nr:hypothetical protein [uncultured Psychroserpens sp.]
MMLIVAPAVIMAIDESMDMSCLYNISEEEEEKESEKNKELEVFVDCTGENEESFISTNRNKYLVYAFKNYPKPHLNLISPPPEFIS